QTTDGNPTIPPSQETQMKQACKARTPLLSRRYAGRVMMGLALLATTALNLRPAMAQDAATRFPARTIAWIGRFPPGGAMDGIARVLSESMSQDLGQPIVVENKPGAGGNIGAAAVAQAKPDGYTIMIAANGMAVNPALYKSLNYDPVKD